MPVILIKISIIVELYLIVPYPGTGATYGVLQSAGDGQHRSSQPGAEEPGGGDDDGAQVPRGGWADHLWGGAA